MKPGFELRVDFNFVDRFVSHSTAAAASHKLKTSSSSLKDTSSSSTKKSSYLTASKQELNIVIKQQPQPVLSHEPNTTSNFKNISLIQPILGGRGYFELNDSPSSPFLFTRRNFELFLINEKNE